MLLLIFHFILDQSFEVHFENLGELEVSGNIGLDLGTSRFNLKTSYRSYPDINQNVVLLNIPRFSTDLLGTVKLRPWGTLSFDVRLIGERPFNEMPIFINALTTPDRFYKEGTLDAYISGNTHFNLACYQSL